ncbi:MAG TPA: hypothetical protein VJN64_06210 [Terriglobales bacterium]|nr:hypothetical protein [Terriglobales bacterium]
MADLGYGGTRVAIVRNRIDWGAIWGGVFCFMAIWSVFGALGLAIFASAASPGANAPVLGMSAGIAIWAVILTIIAMYVAGRETGRLAGVTNRHDGLVHGLMMFGLSVVSLIVLVSIGGSVLSGNTGVAGSTHSPYLLTVFADLGWGGFVALFLGWLAAMWGSSSGVTHKAEVTTGEVREIRPAA